MTSGMHDQTLQWQFTEINHRRLIQVGMAAPQRTRVVTHVPFNGV